MWFDTHCHLHDLPKPDEAFNRAREALVTGLVCVGTDIESSNQAIELVQRIRNLDGYKDRSFLGMWTTVGLHPHYATRDIKPLYELVADCKTKGYLGSLVVGIGECGLDYHYDNSPRSDQKDTFKKQLGLAQELGLALVVHTREAWEDTFDILETEGVPSRVIFHCFSGAMNEAKHCLDMGAWLSFSGILTFKNALDLRETAARCPLDKILIETDTPYLAPVPHRGQPNEPAFVSLVGKAVAEVKGMDVEAVANATMQSAIEVFGLDRRE
ncbi:MAG: TatD family hydrolase [Actinobacteria bacterium]|nr:TatD family hydrolase [Actinomycetota bacterium]MCL6104575.1 TatD family hydrolase [Actinomycetota bacterium]